MQGNRASAAIQIYGNAALRLLRHALHNLIQPFGLKGVGLEKALRRDFERQAVDDFRDGRLAE